MAGLTQHRCDAIAHKLNTRPRKRPGFRTPLERFGESWPVLHSKLMPGRLAAEHRRQE